MHILHSVFCNMQAGLDERGRQLQNQVAMNQQLMKRKEDMEWQLMSVLAQVDISPDSAKSGCTSCPQQLLCLALLVMGSYVSTCPMILVCCEPHLPA